MFIYNSYSTKLYLYLIAENKMLLNGKAKIYILREKDYDWLWCCRPELVSFDLGSVCSLISFQTEMQKS